VGGVKSRACSSLLDSEGRRGRHEGWSKSQLCRPHPRWYRNGRRGRQKRPSAARRQRKGSQF